MMRRTKPGQDLGIIPTGGGSSRCKDQRPEGAENWRHEGKLGWHLPSRVECGGDEVGQIMKVFGGNGKEFGFYSKPIEI